MYTFDGHNAYESPIIRRLVANNLIISPLVDDVAVVMPTRPNREYSLRCPDGQYGKKLTVTKTARERSTLRRTCQPHCGGFPVRTANLTICCQCHECIVKL